MSDISPTMKRRSETSENAFCSPLSKRLATGRSPLSNISTASNSIPIFRSPGWPGRVHQSKVSVKVESEVEQRSHIEETETIAEPESQLESQTQSDSQEGTQDDETYSYVRQISGLDRNLKEKTKELTGIRKELDSAVCQLDMVKTELKVTVEVLLKRTTLERDEAQKERDEARKMTRHLTKELTESRRTTHSLQNQLTDCQRQLDRHQQFFRLWAGLISDNTGTSQ
ncbi:hypothetical protein D9758_010855 [Tetrapyrgos nigripes]|uniref:Uncharacterized protein n=1 Tax=Tetrapyrgos nigripes TaxID=182062 RepID=A0A8H5GIE3_9AGAR|nr:hypothetical protein D9758_010855 [Tetrapyrgos nigripes]